MTTATTNENLSADERNAVRFYELAQDFSTRFGWSFAKIARDGLGIPSQWLYRYFARAKTALGEDATMKGDRAPSKGTVRAMELLVELHEAKATAEQLRDSVTTLAGSKPPEDENVRELRKRLIAMEKSRDELRELLTASYQQWSVKNLRAECARRGLPGKAGDVLADYVERLVASDGR